MSEVAGKRTAYSIMLSTIKKDFIPSPEEMKQINSFMMCRFISNHPYGIEVANFINNTTDLPIEAQYWFIRSKLNNVRFITQQKKNTEEDKNINIIAEHYSCNFETAKQYYKILPQEEREKIIQKYNHIGRMK